MPKGALAVVSHVGPVAVGDACQRRMPCPLWPLWASRRGSRSFGLLMQREPGGMPAGALAEAIGCPANTLSTHLAILARAGLVRGERDGRSIIYHADVEGMRALMSFLVTDCCGGHPELCDFSGKASRAPVARPPRGPRRRRR